MKQFFKIMGGIEAALCCTCTIVMLTLAFANVVGRYVLHSSISFTEEIVCGLFVLLGAGVAVMLIKLGWEMIQTQIRLGSITATLQWPAWIYSMAIPVGGVFMLIRFVQAAVCKALDKEVL